MKKSLFRERTVLALTTVSLFLLCATTVLAATCPSGAICRDETPGSYSTSGPYGYTTTTSLPGVTNAATIYIPRTAAAPFSSIIFMQPYTGYQYMDAAWGPFFASHGIVYVNADALSTMTDTVDMRATQQWDIYNAFKALNTRTGHVLKGKLNTSRIGLMGWSMGGGATWINASKTGVKTACSLAGHNLTAVSPLARGASTKCPMLLMNGATDLTYLGGMGQSEGVYNNIPSGISKVLYVVALAGHMDWGDPNGLLTPNAGKIALAFQKTYLDGDTRWKSYIKNPGDASTWRAVLY
jgi:pimeloyl-ACP methyl ester carboxylesterase